MPIKWHLYTKLSYDLLALSKRDALSCQSEIESAYRDGASSVNLVYQHRVEFSLYKKTRKSLSTSFFCGFTISFSIKFLSHFFQKVCFFRYLLAS